MRQLLSSDPPWHVDEGVKWWLGFFATLSAVFLFLSPIPTFVRIVKMRSTEEFSAVPYLCTLLQTSAMVAYASPFVTPHREAALLTNAIGASIESVYIAIFIVFASTTHRSQFYSQCALTAALMAAVLATCLVLQGPLRSDALGMICDVFGVVMLASPLTVMRRVLATRSVKYMPLMLSVGVLACCSAWTAYGVYLIDIYIIIPNGLGCVFGAIQLALYFYVSVIIKSTRYHRSLFSFGVAVYNIYT